MIVPTRTWFDVDGRRYAELRMDEWLSFLMLAPNLIVAVNGIPCLDVGEAERLMALATKGKTCPTNARTD